MSNFQTTNKIKCEEHLGMRRASIRHGTTQKWSQAHSLTKAKSTHAVKCSRVPLHVQKRNIITFSKDSASKKINRLRKIDSFVKNCIEDPSALVLLFDSNYNPLFTTTPSNESKLVWKSWLDTRTRLKEGAEDDVYLLSWHHEKACPLFALPIHTLLEGESNRIIDPSEKFDSVRKLLPQLSPFDAALVAQGKSVLHWQSESKFCGKCGSKTKSVHGGSERTCTVCSHNIYPRTDPAVIMLIHSPPKGEEYCLLGRQKVWDKGRYSTLAGFVEPGESIEDAVRREVEEESGVIVGPVKYNSSQGWPFPHSLMLGCHGRAMTDEIELRDEELEDARWFKKDEVLKMLKGDLPGFSLPPSYAISHHLIKSWATDSINSTFDKY